MLLLGQKNGKFHWMKYKSLTEDYEFISDEENNAWWKAEQDRFEKIAADIYNNAFNASQS